jgi:Ser/Thr protein kinase RdoA (MazF antagonist)
LSAELAWLNALRRDSDLPVPEPLQTRDGDWMVAVAQPGVPEPRHCVVFSWLAGLDLGDRLTPKNVERFGAFAAKLHGHGASFTPPDNSTLRAADRVFHFDEPVVLFDDAYAAILPASRRAFFQTVVNRIQDAIDRLKASGEPMRVVHGDLHRWNVKISRGQIAAFDFEEMLLGWPVQDIGTTLHYFYGEENFPDIRAAFQRGYESVAPWPERYKGEVDTFIAGRNMVLANTILQRLNAEERAEAPYYLETTERRLRALFAGEPFHLRYW